MRVKMIELVELMIANREQEEPYYNLLGDGISVFDTLHRTEEFIGKVLGIPEEWMDTIYEFSLSKRIVINDELITDTERFVDVILQILEG